MKARGIDCVYGYYHESSLFRILCRKNTIDWLIQEVCRRYSTQHFQRPTITLLTSDGTLLKSDDLVLDVLSDGDCVREISLLAVNET